MNRRNFLISASLGTAGAALAACSATKNLNPEQITQLVVTDAQGIANGLAAVVPNLTNVPANVLTELQAAAKDAAQVAATLVATMTQTAAQPLVQRIEGDVQGFLTGVKNVVTSPTVQSILSDIQVVLPFIVAAVGLVVPAALAKTSSPVEAAAARARLAALPQAK